MIDAALKDYLISQAAFSSLCGDKLYPDLVPEEVPYPAVAYQRISTHRLYGINGPIGYAEARIQFSVFALNADSALAVVEAIRAGIDGFRATIGGVNVREIGSYDERSAYEPVSKSPERQIDFYVGYEE
jgi:hypothetical protein